MTPIFKYTVCWRDDYCREYEWKHKVFTTKIKAKQFAKEHKNKIKPKPYILQTITDIGFIKSTTEVEYVKNRKIVYRNYQKKIRY